MPSPTDKQSEASKPIIKIKRAEYRVLLGFDSSMIEIDVSDESKDGAANDSSSHIVKTVIFKAI